MTDLVITAFSKKQIAVMVSLDLEKVFDKFHHEGLLLKMKGCGFLAGILKTVRTYPQNRSFHTVVNGSNFFTRRIESGIISETFQTPAALIG
ncbi:hypothetical protein Trydic_g11734 [Trypoxylus dichotomus]